MANIKLDITNLYNGKFVTFPAPCDCDKVTDGLIINGETYTVCDAMGNTVTGAGGVWCSGAQISVVLDCENKKAYLQNGNATPAMIGAVPTVTVDYTKETMSADDMAVPLALIKIGSTSNAELWEAFEKVESYAYIRSVFFYRAAADKSHVQIAYSYTNAPAKMAVRTYNSNTGAWTPWRAIAGVDYAVNKSGDTMTGNLTIAKANPDMRLNDSAIGNVVSMMGTTNTLILRNFNAGSSSIRRQVELRNSDRESSIATALKLWDVTADGTVGYDILHSGNMDSLLGNVAKVDTGTYTGTGTRAVNITFPSVPKMVFICTDITDSAGTRAVKIVWMNGSDSPHILETSSTSFCTASLEGNTLTIEADGAIANYSGMTYTYYAIL